MALAAYNAGAGRVAQWIPAYGDPRTGAVDPVDWVERIPFDETRDYVQRVSENLAIYRARLGVDAASRRGRRRGWRGSNRRRPGKSRARDPVSPRARLRYNPRHRRRGTIPSADDENSRGDAPLRMTTEEAFIKVLQLHGIEQAFGIIGSAMMPVSDLFPARGHHVLGLRARDQRRHHVRRLHPRDRQDGDGDRAERAGRDRLRHGDEDRLLEPYAAAAGDAAGRQQDDGAGRLPGSAADGAVPGHGLLSGGGARSLAHCRGAQPRDRQGVARLGRPRRSTCRAISGPR